MKINEIEIIKNIMTKIEQLDDFDCNKLKIEGLSYEAIFHYCKLLQKVGYLDKVSIVSNNVYIGQLSFKGCEFLEKLRSEKILDITTSIIIKNKMNISLRTLNYISDLVLQKVVDDTCEKILSAKN